MSVGVRVFIGLVFAAIGVSFLVTTGVMVWEFRDLDWLTIANFYSHLFVFFPTFGIVALIAFYVPACVFMDMYMKFIPAGAVRFWLGFIIAILISILVADHLQSNNERSIFEVGPQVLEADLGAERRVCQNPDLGTRLPILAAVDNVERVSQTRFGLSDLVRTCKPDVLIATGDEAGKVKRFCFPSTALPGNFSDTNRKQLQDLLETDEACCKAQQCFTEAVNSMHAQPDGASLTGVVHAWLLPFKIFFGVILLVISMMLAGRAKAIEQHYQSYADAIQRGVLIGALALVIFPIMSHAFQQSAALLYYGVGPTGGYRSAAHFVSFAVFGWGLLILFFFWRKGDNAEIQTIVRIGGIIASAIAAFNYETLIDFFVWAVGSGAGLANLLIVTPLAVLAIIWVVRWSRPVQ